MPIYVPSSRRETTSDYLPCPEGTHNAVVVDVGLPYLRRTEYQGRVQEKVTCHLAFQVAKKMESGRRFSVSQRYTVSLWKKANLTPVFRSLMGREPTDSEQNDGTFDLESFIGRPCTINVVHSTDKEGKVWANVAAVTPHMEGMPILKPEGYDRWQDREKKPSWWPTEPLNIVAATDMLDDYEPVNHGPGADDEPLPF